MFRLLDLASIPTQLKSRLNARYFDHPPYLSWYSAMMGYFMLLLLLETAVHLHFLSELIKLSNHFAIFHWGTANYIYLFLLQLQFSHIFFRIWAVLINISDELDFLN